MVYYNDRESLVQQYIAWRGATQLVCSKARVFLTTGDPVPTSHHSQRYFGEYTRFAAVTLS